MKFPSLVFAVWVALGTPAYAQSQRPQTQQSLSDWEALTPAQREVLIAPLRARWNDNPTQRAEMMHRAQHWASMSPTERKLAQRGMHRWEKLSPEQRAEAKELYLRMKTMTPEARRALRDQWHSMTAEQRAAWLKANPPR